MLEDKTSEIIDMISNVVKSSYVKNNIKYYRKQHNMTQKQLAKYCGINTDTIKRIENNKHSTNIKTAILISNCLEVDVKDLFYISL